MAKKDATLDRFVTKLGEYYGEGLDETNAKNRVSVEIWAYNGLPKVNIARHMKLKGNWNPIKTGRLTGAEALAVSRILTDNVTALNSLVEDDKVRHQAKVDALLNKQREKSAAKDEAKAARAKEVEAKREARKAESLQRKLEKDAIKAAEKAAKNAATA